jgi:hypothetical protein
VLIEVEVELRHFPKGYDVQVFSELLSEKISSLGSEKTEIETEESSGSTEQTTDPLTDMSHGIEASGEASAERAPTLYIPLNAAAHDKKDLPAQIKVYDLPPSAVLAATLDPSARPRKHLLRVTMPTTSFLHPIEDPLTGSKAPEIPDWYTSLQERGAALRIVLRPEGGAADLAPASGNSKEATALPSFATPMGKVPVYSDGSKLGIVHVNQTSAMLQKEPIGIEPMTQLKRAAPVKSKAARKTDSDTNAKEATADDRLPAMLREPVALNDEALKAQVSPGTANRSERDAGAKMGGTSRGDGTAVPGNSPGTHTPADGTHTPVEGSSKAAAGASTANMSAMAGSSGSTSTGAQIMNMFGSYPLSRLGTASALASVTSVTARGSNVASTSSAKTNAEALAANDRVKKLQKPGADQANSAAGSETSKSGETANGKESDSSAATATATAVDAAANAGSTLLGATKSGVQAVRRVMGSEAKLRFSTVVLVALASFLLGSLVRSLLAPTDFVLVPTKHVAFDTRALSLSGEDARAKKPSRTLGRLTDKLARSGSRSDKALRKQVEDYLSLMQELRAKGSAAPGPLAALQRELGHNPAQTHADGLVRQVQWTELRRVLHMRSPVPGWDFVVGAVQRRP